jgi:hypothetical protein
VGAEGDDEGGDKVMMKASGLSVGEEGGHGSRLMLLTDTYNEA